ncbi:hypothetical protein [Dyadobacter sp. 3J3]|uniref:hypothetical protein n=1 Tax=Dyadobacter sp. 3J3 TaxID=2606600 RepID=UPI001357E700|nr:hypothetical protein [Dyadobacter sp. 3J3]
MKVYYNKKQRNFNIGSVVVMALGLMAIHGRESFDPTTYWFWASLVQSLLMTLFFGTISFKKTQNNPDILIGKED